MNALKTILYFSIFSYPLTKEEIFNFSCSKSLTETEDELNHLVSENIIDKQGEFYTEFSDKNVIEHRLKGNKAVIKIMPKALRRAKLIMSFPFIKSVCISGSLSKNFYDDSGDIDFFIITQPNYLWLARTLLIIYKKTVLLNKKKHFCVNYFISTDKLVIEEQNLFTATELSTLMPIYGEEIFKTFLNKNYWAKLYYPNLKTNYTQLQKPFKKPLWSKCLHLVLHSALGRKLDAFFKKITISKWRSKFKHLKKRNFEIALKSTNDVSKHHPKDYQSKVIVKLNQKYENTNKRYNLKLELEHA